jgi:filamentous hemagglutinin family protein
MHLGWRFIGTLLCSSWLLCSLSPAPAQGQVPTAIKPDSTLGTTVTQNGTVYDITNGTLKGSNLLHSFQHFQLGTNETARFSGQSGITNILSRVTGGAGSTIDGRMVSTIEGANLFLLNPAGVLFGPNATLQVRGSFHVSTADALRFADGTTFHAHPSLDAMPDSILRVAPPAAFGFLGNPTAFAFTNDNPASITIDRSVLVVPSRQTFSVIGGDITVDGGDLRAPSGRLNMASVAAPGSVTISGTEPPSALQVDGFERLGAIDLSQKTRIDVSDASINNGSGTVVIRGGRLHINDSSVRANARGNTPGAETGVDIAVTEALDIADGATIETSTILGTGRAGAIKVQGGQVRLTGGAQVNSNTAATGGPGGTIEVTATDSVVLSGGNDAGPSRLASATSGDREAGLVKISAPVVRVEKGALIQATTSRTGRAGAIEVTATDGQITVTEGAQILSTTSFDNPAGPVGGPGGDIMLNAGVIDLSQEARVSVESTGTGNAGSIRIAATDTFRSTDSSVTTRAEKSQGGTIQITAQTMVRLRHSEVTTTVAGGDERAGNVTIDPEFVILENSNITANAVGGPGGNIAITAGTFLADPASTVSASSARNIDGEISIRAPVQDLSGAATPLPQDVVPATVLLSDQCAARLREGVVSSLVTRGRDGIPASPEGVLPGRPHDARAASPAVPGAPSSPVATTPSHLAKRYTHTVGQPQSTPVRIPAERSGTRPLHCPPQ